MSDPAPATPTATETKASPEPPPSAPAGAPPQLRPLNMGVVLRLGRRYLGRHKGSALAYIILFLLVQTIIPLAIATNAGRLTNYFQAQSAPAVAAEAAPGATALPNAGEAPDAAAIPAPPEQTTRDLVSTYGLWVVLTLLLVGATFSQRYITSYLAGAVGNDIRKDLFASLLSRPAQFFHKHDSDQLTMIVNQFAMQVQNALQSLLIDPVLNVIGMIVLGTSLYRQLSGGARETGSQLWIFFGVIVLIALLSPWIVSLMGRKLQQSSMDLQQQALLVQSLVGGALKAPEEIQAMRAEGIFDRKHAAALDASLRSRLNQTTTIEKLNVANQMPGNFVLIALLGLAVFAAVSGPAAISGGVVIILFTLTPQFMGAVQGLSAFSITASMNWPAVDTVDELLKSDSGEHVVDGTAQVEDLPPTLEARNIVFRYPGASKIVLNDVSFSVPPGKVSGFVAKAGQGKTTFFRLALRFYEPESGEILIGGMPHRSLPLSTLRRKVVLMHQSPAFFHDTIRENFLIANPKATDDEIRALCEKTPLWRILNNAYGANPLDQQFVGGNFLSGGQKKLFAITRCLLRDPTILLLDEPTTGIDPSEKFDLVTMMRQACAGRTVMVVDHDIVGWQVLFCDHIFVLNEGKLEQQGAPGELLSRGGLFRDLFDDQAAGFHKMTEAMRAAEAKRLPGDAAMATAEATV